ncbi:MAG TPA: PAS domain-containing protein, partial [Allocoleopsis sp.]
MPDLSGYEVCQRLKADEQTRDIPVIFISALHEPFDKVKAFQVGGVDYITKPFHLDEILARIQNQLALRFSLAHIHQLNVELEHRVQERTAQIERVNQSLQQEIIERRQIEQSLRDSEANFRQISEHIQEVFWLQEYDPVLAQPTTLVYVSSAYETIWGRTCKALYANLQEWLAAIHEEDRQRVELAFIRQAGQGTYDEEYRVIRPDGSIRWIRDRGFPIYHPNGIVYRVAGIAEDITERKQAELERDRFFNLSLDLLFIANDQGIFKRLNPAWEELLGYSDRDLLDQCFWHLIHPDDQTIVQLTQQLLHRGEDVNTVEMRCRCKNGSYLWIAWNAVPFLQENLIYGAGRNISQRKESEARLVHETLHDALTGLANRTCFMERLERAIKKSHRELDSCFAVLFIDLDDFKRINDTLGHGIGDQLLIQISQTLKGTVREVDSVARLGGDEFTILLEEVQNLKEVLNIAERIQEKLKPPFQL